MISAKLKERGDDKQRKALLRRIRELESHTAETGWFDGENHTSGLTTASLAYALEYGGDDSSGNRFQPFSFMSISAKLVEDDNRFTGIIKQGVQKHLANKSYVDEFMFDLGKFMEDRVRGVMGSSPPLRPNTEYTQELKGGNTPTVDSGELKSKLRTKVEDNSGAT